MRRTLGAAAISTALALSACSGDDGAGPSTSAAESTTTTSVATTTSAPSTTTTAAAACPTGTAPGGDQEQRDVPGDLDGDGQDDVVHVWRQDDDETVTWVIQVVLAAGGQVTQDVPDDGVAAVSVLGAHDLDGDGTDELWARIGSGASAGIVGLYRLDGCDLEAVTADGRPVELPVGGSVGTASGVTCVDGGVEVHALRSSDGEQYAVTTQRLAYADGELTPFGDPVSTTLPAGLALEPVTGFHCAHLTA